MLVIIPEEQKIIGKLWVICLSNDFFYIKLYNIKVGIIKLSPFQIDIDAKLTHF